MGQKENEAAKMSCQQLTRQRYLYQHLPVRVLNPKGWCFLAPQTSSMKAPRKEDPGMCLVCVNFWSLVVTSFCPSRKGYPIDFPLALKLHYLGPHVFEEGDFWMFQLFKNVFLMLPPKKNGAPKYIMTFHTFLKDAPKIYPPVI